jgi:hypothetical protein
LFKVDQHDDAGLGGNARPFGKPLRISSKSALPKRPR